LQLHQITDDAGAVGTAIDVIAKENKA